MKRNANAISAVIKNWSQVEAATEAATNATGTAASENAKYMNSMQGKIDALKASWQALSNSILSSDFLKGLISGANGFITFLDKINNDVTRLPLLIGGVTAAMSAWKNIGGDKMFSLNNREMPIVVIVLFGYEQFRYYQC